MLRILAAILILSMGFAGTATAQQAYEVPADQATVANCNMQTAAAAGRRISELLAATLSDPRLNQARTPQDMAAFFDITAPQITAARTEIKALEASLRGLPLVGTDTDAIPLILTDRIVRDFIELAVRADALLASAEQIRDAVHSGDTALYNHASGQFRAGAVALMEAQGLMVRSRLPFIPSDTVLHAQLSAMACFSDGLATVQRRIYGIQDRQESVEGLKGAHDCMIEHIALGRAALSRDRSDVPSDAVLADIMAELNPLREEFFRVLDTGAALIADLRDRTAAGGDMGPVYSAQLPAINEFQQVLQSLFARELDIMARQGQ
ncbi:hypothetical protein [Brevundimonas sp.]|uniref:hypothetical protein n=1 Tax=Brevundimonas sp. TaxID=1871086 RepID=UPI002ABAA673|nr:hypothetical protein [Brevundimonas sp.]MDZ4364432.1 hypothetical protein [Brevundimonas sp.]